MPPSNPKVCSLYMTHSVLANRNKKDLVAFVPFLALITLPGTFLIMPLAFKFAPTLIPSMFRTAAMEEMISGKPEKKIEILAAFPGDLLQATETSTKGIGSSAHEKIFADLKADLQKVVQTSARGGLTFESLLKAKEVALFVTLNSFSKEQLKNFAYYLGKPSLFAYRTLQSHLHFVMEDDKASAIFLPLLSRFLN